MSYVAREQLTERVNLRVSGAELSMLHDLSEASGLSMSDVLRQLLRREHADRFGERFRATRSKRRR